MNKEIFIVFLFLLFLYLFSCNIEGMRNPLIIPGYEFSILTAPQEVTSGYFQENLCKNDPDWKFGDKTCDNILSKDECNLKSDKGVLANDVCLIACDTCPSSVTIKHREPMPVGEDTDLSARGINIEDSDGYDYMEIYDAFENIDYDIEVLNDKYEEFKIKHPSDSYTCPIECLTSDTYTQFPEGVGTEAGTDTGTEAEAGTGTEAEAEAGTEAVTDAEAEAGIEAGTDAGIEAGTVTPESTAPKPCPPGCLFNSDTS